MIFGNVEGGMVKWRKQERRKERRDKRRKEERKLVGRTKGRKVDKIEGM